MQVRPVAPGIALNVANSGIRGPYGLLYRRPGPYQAGGPPLGFEKTVWSLLGLRGTVGGTCGCHKQGESKEQYKSQFGAIPRTRHRRLDATLERYQPRGLAAIDMAIGKGGNPSLVSAARWLISYLLKFRRQGVEWNKSCEERERGERLLEEGKSQALNVPQ